MTRGNIISIFEDKVILGGEFNGDMYYTSQGVGQQAIDILLNIDEEDRLKEAIKNINNEIYGYEDRYITIFTKDFYKNKYFPIIREYLKKIPRRTAKQEIKKLYTNMRNNYKKLEKNNGEKFFEYLKKIEKEFVKYLPYKEKLKFNQELENARYKDNGIVNLEDIAVIKKFNGTDYNYDITSSYYTNITDYNYIKNYTDKECLIKAEKYNKKKKKEEQIVVLKPGDVIVTFFTLPELYIDNKNKLVKYIGDEEDFTEELKKEIENIPALKEYKIDTEVGLQYKINNEEGLNL